MTPGETSRATVPAPVLEDVPEYLRALERSATYLSDAQRQQLRRAWAVGAAAHAGQVRRSGEAYITHPVAVAAVLAEQKLDVETLIAAILHDTIEDTDLTREALAEEFGETVAELVEGVTKLDRLHFADRQEAAAESFRKMLLAMARDLRVILIKLADRLHNMRTLDAQSPQARARIARETLEIYAPIAQRLGMNMIKAELQDLGFRALHPLRHQVLEKRIRNEPLVRREALARIEAQLAQRLTKEGLEYRLLSRVKSPWSIYGKMQEEGKSFGQVTDVFGFRVIVGSVAECYYALGIVHAVYKPLDGRFRDFIAIPKANGYQSLHTVLFGTYGSPIEVQIRTEEMDLIAERGIAAHWVYKHGGNAPNSAQARAHSWITDLLESQQGTGSSLEFLENVKVDLFPDEVYLFTPKGDILSLPRNATALDFAYAVHTDVGNQAVAARVDRRLVPLRTKLASGQKVEIVTAKSSHPKPQWLEFVVTGKARTAIRHQLKHIEHEDAVQLGHRMLDRALEEQQSSLERLPTPLLDAYLAEHRYPRLEALLADIALGNRMPALVVQALLRHAPEATGEARAAPGDRLLITGNERGVITFANCCMPIPGDDIMGYHTAGRGIVVHRIDCANVAEYRKSPDRWVDIGWDRTVVGDYNVALRIEVENRPGVLAQVAAAIAKAESNIDGVEYLERDTNIAAIRFGIEVQDRVHLAEVIRRTRRLAVVHGVQRL
ncbi:MAG: bifunctional (p)ppGpp synthetase/guanosine-3',5'-bis(diphosphate) 3'-pyrophosphohydrolase [Pseudomonadota bacterium]|nr:bifunctional (p)ppGpp synthetase/guanosine-3',5'-bis(diphosphate) 3'-pyrophosphohydrolase [Pseudomonadota bacterium]